MHVRSAGERSPSSSRTARTAEQPANRRSSESFVTAAPIAVIPGTSSGIVAAATIVVGGARSSLASWAVMSGSGANRATLTRRMAHTSRSNGPREPPRQQTCHGERTRRRHVVERRMLGDVVVAGRSITGQRPETRSRRAWHCLGARVPRQLSRDPSLHDRESFLDLGRHDAVVISRVGITGGEREDQIGVLRLVRGAPRREQQCHQKETTCVQHGDRPDCTTHLAACVARQ